MDSYNYETQGNETICTIIYDGLEFVGKAKCHPDDMDYYSEITGSTIAEARAQQKVLKHVKNNIIIPQLKIIKHIYCNFNTSTHIDKTSKPYKIIKKQYFELEEELKQIKQDIKDNQIFIYNYLKGKDKIYTRLRNKAKSE